MTPFDITTRRALGALLFLCAAPACAVARQAAPAAAMDTAACGAVAAAIDSLVIGSAGGRVGLADETAPQPRRVGAEEMSRLADGLPGIDEATLASFREHNAQPMPTCTTLPLVGGMTRIARAQLDALPTANPDEYWRAFHARFPGVPGVTHVSGVGVGRGGRQALLVLDHSCGGTCGAGHIVLLERDDEGKWKVKRAVMTWVS